MVVARERYLDDTARYHLTVDLISQTGVMHSLLTQVPPEVHEQLGDALVRALSDIARLLAPFITEAEASRQTSDFGCGT
jgi:hypothetical protein